MLHNIKSSKSLNLSLMLAITPKKGCLCLFTLLLQLLLMDIGHTKTTQN